MYAEVKSQAEAVRAHAEYLEQLAYRCGGDRGLAYTDASIVCYRLAQDLEELAQDVLSERCAQEHLDHCAMRLRAAKDSGAYRDAAEALESAAKRLARSVDMRRWMQERLSF